MASSFEESFKGIIKGTMTVGDAFRNMLNRMADHFLDTAAKMMANQFQQGLLGLFSNFIPTPKPFGNAPVGPLGNPLSQHTDMTVGEKAMGGPVKGGSSYIVGEKGPELFTPGVSGNITPNHALGGTTNVVVNVDASGSSVEGDDQSANQLGQVIAAAVQAEIVNQKMAGGFIELMASFPTTVNPSYGTVKTSEPKIRIANFGSGYSQRSTFGINQNLKVYKFTWLKYI